MKRNLETWTICQKCNAADYKLVLFVPQADRNRSTSAADSNEEAKKFKCHLCGKKAVSTTGLMQHLRYHLKKDGTDPICEICGKLFKDDALRNKLAKYNQHRLTCVKKHAKSVYCPHCNKKYFSAKRDFQRHVNRCNPDISCKKCGREFKAINWLGRHKCQPKTPAQDHKPELSQSKMTESVIKPHIIRVTSYV